MRPNTITKPEKDSSYITNHNIKFSMKKIGAVALAMLALGSYEMRGDEQTVYAVSNAHLDTQWNWDVQTTIRD